MNIYTLVEGEIGTKIVYGNWFKFVNPDLTYVDYIDEVKNNNIYIIAGFGYPFYFNMIKNAFEDIKAHSIFDRLVIAVDSEDLSFEEKKVEIENYLSNFKYTVDVKIIIQHFCLETWALGNKRINSRFVFNIKLKEYKKFFDFYKNDPELMPPYEKDQLNRAQFAYVYLRALLNEKNRNLTYTKTNTKSIITEPYFLQIKKRYTEFNHIKSFKSFLDAFN